VNTGLEEHAARIVSKAQALGKSLVTAESCTAGALALLLADAPGAAATFHGGFVVYTKDNKTAALGVPKAMLQSQSAVSADVAKALAEGALQRTPADIAVAITGVAGPEPDEDGNPVGLVYVAAARTGKATRVTENRFGATERDAIRDLSLRAALELFEALLLEGEFKTQN
jgi:nicotinamide-nucleotide amidase